MDFFAFDVIGVYSYNDCRISLIYISITFAWKTIKFISNEFSEFTIMPNKIHNNLIVWILKLVKKKMLQRDILSNIIVQYFQYHISIAFSFSQWNWNFIDIICYCWTFIVIDFDNAKKHPGITYRKLRNKVYYELYFWKHTTIYYFDIRII